MKIVTQLLNFPHESKRFIWVAYFAEMGDDGPVGYGTAEDSAIVNLMEQQHSIEEVKNV
jgi:hypothetical protein